MSEKEPSFNIEVAGKKYELNQSNASLYHHLGARALDHFFLQHSKADGIMSGTRFFRELFEEGSFDTTSNFMIQKGFEAHLNIHEPAEDDLNAYVRFSTRGEETPDWLPKI